jgi:hypothetical protein
VQDEQHGIGRGALRALIALTALALSGAARADTQTYTLTSFEALRVEAPVTVVVTTGAGVAARGQGPRGTLNRLRLDVSGRLLTIRIAPLRPGEKAAGPATLQISTGELRRLVLGGGGSVVVNRMKGLAAEIVSGGNGDVTVKTMDVDRLTVALGGGGRVTLAGRAGVADVRVSGPGSVAGEGLAARQVKIGNEGPGTISLTAAVSADIRASGSGDVTVTGKAACTVANEGTGRVSCGGESY